MAILPIHLFGSEILKKKTQPVKDFNDFMVGLIKDMFITMKNAAGLGLAANQIGQPISLAVLDASEINEEKDEEYRIPKELKRPIIMFNPKIIKSWDKFKWDESCLSIPGFYYELIRPDFIRVAYRDGDFNEQILEVGGLFSRAIQHEIDHLNGRIFLENLPNMNTRYIRNNLNKIKKGEFDADYPITFK
jgi:peptide deformylase